MYRVKIGTRTVVVSDVLRSYWFFASERQRVYHRRLAGLAGPWTDDPVISRFRHLAAFSWDIRGSKPARSSHPIAPKFDRSSENSLTRLITTYPAREYTGNVNKPKRQRRRQAGLITSGNSKCQTR